MEICWEKERSESNSTPRLRAWMLGGIGMPRKDMEQLVILERCCLVPIRRNSVLAGFTVRRFKVSQEWMVSRVEDRTERLVVESDEEKEI